VGGFQAAALAQHSEQSQSADHRHESCDAQNSEVRNIVVKRMGVRRPRFMSLRSAEDGEHSCQAKKTFHALMVWLDPEKSSLGIKGKGVTESWSSGVTDG